MLEIIVGFIILIFTTPKQQEYEDSNNEEIIRPILMDNFQDHDSSGFDGE